MSKEIKFKQMTSQMGEVKGILRVINTLIYIRINNPQYSKQVIEQMQKKGAIITKGRQWIRINIFKDNTFVKLGDKELDIKKESPDKIENFIINFFKQKYKTSGFLVEEQ